jgi:hypothetical protein
VWWGLGPIGTWTGPVRRSENVIKVNQGVEAVEIKLIFKDKRRKQTIRINHPRLDYSIDYNVQRVDSWNGPVGYVHTGPATVKFNIEGAVPTKKRR